MKILKFVGLSLILMGHTFAFARKVEKLTKIPFLGEYYCSENQACFRITPDSKGVALINPQRHLIYHDALAQSRFKIAEVGCSSRHCFDFSGDSNWVAYTQVVGEEVNLYVRSLTDLRANLATAAVKIAELPRFANLKGAINHELSFCNSTNTLYVRSGATDVNIVSSYQFSQGAWHEKTIFNTFGGSTGNLNCGQNGEGAYFNVRVPATDGHSQEERIVFAPADLASPVEPSVLFRESNAVGDRLISDFVPIYGQILMSFNSPDWMADHSSSLVAVDNKGTEKVLDYSQNKYFQILTAGSEHALVQSFNQKEGYPGVNLLSISVKTGEQVQLNQQDSFLTTGLIKNDVSVGGERALFFESNSASKNLVLTGMGGAQRQILYSQLLAAPLNTHPVSMAKLTPSGRCVLLKKASSEVHKGQRAELISVDSEVKVDIFPLPELPTEKWTQDSRLGSFEFSPDSSFVIILADLENKSRFDLYRISLPECTTQIKK